MIKNIFSYKKDIRNRVNSDPLIKGHKINEKEITAILRYFNKNVLQICKGNNEVVLKDIWIYPLRKQVFIHEQKIRKIRRNYRRISRT